MNRIKEKTKFGYCIEAEEKNDCFYIEIDTLIEYLSDRKAVGATHVEIMGDEDYKFIETSGLVLESDKEKEERIRLLKISRENVEKNQRRLRYEALKKEFEG